LLVCGAGLVGLLLGGPEGAAATILLTPAVRPALWLLDPRPGVARSPRGQPSPHDFSR
jgi:hypothetical protein